MKKVTICLFKKTDKNVGFIKLIKVLKPRFFLLSPLNRWIHIFFLLSPLNRWIHIFLTLTDFKAILIKNAFLYLWNVIVKKKKKSLKLSW